MGAVIFSDISDANQISRDPVVRDAFVAGLHRALILAGTALLVAAVAVLGGLACRPRSQSTEAIDTKADIS